MQQRRQTVLKLHVVIRKIVNHFGVGTGGSERTASPKVCNIASSDVADASAGNRATVIKSICVR